MKILFFSLLIFSRLILYANSGFACDCNADKASEGFYADLSTQSLPQNAKGVLFFVKSEHSNLPVMYNKLIPEHFSLKDLKDPRELPLKIKKLKMEKVRGDTQKYIIYRLEPVNGFKGGHNYIIRLKEDPAWDPSLYRHILNIKIDSTVISRADLLKTNFSLNGNPRIEYIDMEEGPGCSWNSEAKVQDVKFQLSPRLEAYRNSLRYFVYYQSGDKRQPWIYKKNTCSTLDFGRSAFETGNEVIFITTGAGGTPLIRNKKYQISGSWAFPEVDATVFDSPAFEFSYPR